MLLAGEWQRGCQAAAATHIHNATLMASVSACPGIDDDGMIVAGMRGAGQGEGRSQTMSAAAWARAGGGAHTTRESGVRRNRDETAGTTMCAGALVLEASGQRKQ